MWTERFKKVYIKLKEIIEKLNGKANLTQSTSWVLITARVGLGNVLSKTGLN